MKRHFYISDDLAELEIVEQDLQESGVAKPQIHVLSEKDAEVESHHLHEVDSVLKQDVVHSAETGLIIGVAGASAVLVIASISGWPEIYTWVPFIFLAVVVLGFCTWEGAFIGIQNPHRDFQRFADTLHQGRHVFFVDVAKRQEDALDRVILQHPNMQLAGVGDSSPAWMMAMQKHWMRFTHWAP